MAATAKEVKFVCVARRSDKAVLASRIHSADRSYDYLANVTKVLASPGWASVTTDKVRASTAVLAACSRGQRRAVGGVATSPPPASPMAARRRVSRAPLAG